MHNLYTYLRICQKECLKCGIFLGEIADISVNYRAEKRWGQCIYKEDENAYYINISYKLVDDDTPIKTLKETILHELCHTIDGGLCHTGEWKKAVTLLNQAYGYNIKRINSYEDKGVSRKKFPPKKYEAKYHIACQQCGTVLTRTRKSKFVAHPEKYRCGICGGNFKQIQ